MLGTDPGTGLTVVAKSGRFGPYVTEVLAEDAPASAKPRTGSLLKSMSLDTMTLDEALRLLSLPRVIGELDGEQVTAQNGRYGPYVKKGTDSRSLDSEDKLFSLTLAEAKDLFSQPKARAPVGRVRAAAARAGCGPGQWQPDGGEERAVRPVRDRRGDERVAAQGRRCGHADRAARG